MKVNTYFQVTIVHRYQPGWLNATDYIIFFIEYDVDLYETFKYFADQSINNSECAMSLSGRMNEDQMRSRVNKLYGKLSSTDDPGTNIYIQTIYLRNVDMNFLDKLLKSHKSKVEDVENSSLCGDVKDEVIQLREGKFIKN